MFRNDIEQVTSIPLLQDAWTNMPAVTLALQACTTKANQDKLTRPKGNNRNNSWLKGNDGVTMFNTIVPPNAQQYQRSSCSTHKGLWAGNSQLANANSNHQGGANVLFVDGSVHFMKSSINMQTYWKLGTKSNGEVVSSDSY